MWTWVFLTVQLALTVMVLAKLDLTIEQYRANQASEPVLDAKRILTFGLTLPDESYREPGRREAFYRNLRERLIGPGHAVAVSVASAVPTAGRVRSIAPGDQPFSASSPLVRTVAIDAAYFQTVGLTLVQGRSFAANSATDERTGLVVNQRFVDLFLPGGNPVGQSIRLGSPPGAPVAPEEVRTVIGVVPSLREQPTAEPLPAAFVPLTPAALSNSVVLLRTEGDPAALPPVIREEVRKLDPEVPVTGLLTLEDASWRARWNSRVSLRIITTIAFIALALATVGLASLTAYAVAQRQPRARDSPGAGSDAAGHGPAGAAAGAAAGRRRRRRRMDRRKGVGPQHGGRRYRASVAGGGGRDGHGLVVARGARRTDRSATDAAGPVTTAFRSAERVIVSTNIAIWQLTD